jgi:hypothetical protein
MQLIFRVSSIAGPCSGLSCRRSGFEPVFRCPFGSEMGARERAAASQAAFLSVRMTIKSSEGGKGKRVNRPPLPHFTHSYDLVWIGLFSEQGI